jgi:addiction module HigA family antidote
MGDLPPIHPGEQLREEFMAPLGLSAYRLAKHIDVPVSRVQAIVAEYRSITGDTALRLARYKAGREPTLGLPVVEPTQAATTMAIGAVRLAQAK